MESDPRPYAGTVPEAQLAQPVLPYPGEKCRWWSADSVVRLTKRADEARMQASVDEAATRARAPGEELAKSWHRSA
jgi:hypothetical protein